MDEYTFIAEDSTAADQIGSAPAMQDVSDEQLYEHELAQQMQVTAPHIKIVICHLPLLQYMTSYMKAAC